MYTSTELQLLRNADPGVKLPGIDTPAGNLLSAAALEPYTSVSTSSQAPVFYDAANNRVVVRQAGAVVSGINFGSATLDIDANNVTVKDCTFAPTSGWYSVVQYGAGATIENCSFTGPTYSTPLNAFITSVNPIAVENNRFIDTPSHAVNMQGGVVSGNYFSGEGFQTGAHADAIWVNASTTPTSTSISDNFIDWTPTRGAAVNGTFDIYITNGANVSVTGNYLLGGTDTVYASGTNINISGNYLGFPEYSPFYSTSTPGVTESGNTIFDWTNPTYAAAAWTAYAAAGIPTSNLIVSTGGNIQNASSSPTTLYNGGIGGVSMRGGYYGALSETNFVGGYGTQYMYGGTGANIFTELSISNSLLNHGMEQISTFDPAKDVIDLSRVQANLTNPGQGFTFIGTGAFTAAGAEVRYQQDPSQGVTEVDVAMAGDTSPDMIIQLKGLFTLTAANFALTPAQSSADMTGGASLNVTPIKPSAGSAMSYAYTNVTGRPYSSYTSITYGPGGVSQVVADDLVLGASASQLDIYGGTVTVSRGSGAETFQVAGSSFALAYHSSETIQAGAAGSDAFQFTTSYGSETIDGFNTAGSADTLQLQASAFSYLSAGMTQAQDLSAVLAHAVSGGSGTTIQDSQGDSLTLAGVSAAAIAANPSWVKFV